MRHRTAVRRRAGVVGAILGALASWLVLPVALVELDEGAVPPVSEVQLPDGAQIRAQELQCGSGGCWHQLVVTWPEHTSNDLRASLMIGGDPPQDHCRRVSILDRRKICVFEVVTAQVRPDGDVLISERWNRPLAL